MKRSTSLTSLGLASVLALVGCGDGTEETSRGASSEAATSSAPTTTGSNDAEAVSGSEISAEHNDADVMFAQMMIPHHQQAVQMSQTMLAKQDVDPQVQELAGKIKAAQDPEIQRMNDMLTTWGQEPVTASPGSMGHGSTEHGSGSGMEGMMSQRDMDQLEVAQGDEAAQQFLTGMVFHHRGAVEMAQAEIDNGSNPQAVELAQKIIKDQQTEIQEMEGMLDQRQS